MLWSGRIICLLFRERIHEFEPCTAHLTPGQTKAAQKDSSGKGCSKRTVAKMSMNIEHIFLPAGLSSVIVISCGLLGGINLCHFKFEIHAYLNTKLFEIRQNPTRKYLCSNMPPDMYLIFVFTVFKEVVENTSLMDSGNRYLEDSIV